MGADLKRLVVLEIFLLVSSSIAFSQENQTVSTVVEKKSFFDSVSPHITVSQRDSLLVSKGQREARSSTTLYNVGATLSKGDFSLSGNYYLFRKKVTFLKRTTF